MTLGSFVQSFSGVPVTRSKLLKLNANSTVSDMGAGTGAFALHAAKHCQKVYALDVSSAMLNRCQKKCGEMWLSNVLYCHGGFLTYEHEAMPAEAIVSIAALHHLPDFWKLVALTRAAEMLKVGAVLSLWYCVSIGSNRPGRPDQHMDQINRSLFRTWTCSRSRDPYPRGV